MKRVIMAVLLAVAFLITGCEEKDAAMVGPEGPMKFDKNGDKHLSFDEFSATPIAENAPSPEAARQRFDQIDSNRDGLLSMDELKAAMEKARASGDGDGASGGKKKEKAQASSGAEENPMTRLDTDRDGFVSFDEFMAGPGGQGEPGEARRRFESIDTDGDGKLSAAEIRAFFQNQNQPGS